MFIYRVMENEYVYCGKSATRHDVLETIRADGNKYAGSEYTLTALEKVAEFEGVITLRLSRGAVVTVAYKEDYDV